MVRCARVAELARVLRRRNSPAAAATPPPSDTEVSPNPVGDQPSESSEPQAPTSIEVAGGNAQVTTDPAEIVPGSPVVEVGASTPAVGTVVEVASDAGEPSKFKKRKRKSTHRNKSKSKSSSKSSKRSSKISKCRVAKEAAEEEENTRHFKDLVAWWKDSREALKTSSSKVAKLNPEWAIFARSSVLRTHVGQDSFELYKACCLDRDQVLLAQTTHTRVEEHLAHVLMQASTFGYNLALKCLMFLNDKAMAEQKINELQEGLDRAQAAEKEALEAKAVADVKVAALEAQLLTTQEENKKKVADALEYGRTDGFSAGLIAKKTEGARDFLKAPAFKIAVDLQSAHYLNDGFDKCIAQIQHLHGFVAGFDQNRLDSSLDGQLQPYPLDDVPNTNGEDEFASLVDEVGDLP
ncbi:hypothetical protein Salat_1177700 [Sesamum alatum]|uniref:Uncharacterized protein n=1 Tax=Sesamum alatum TaxID=300844 RepID=A0AAE2CNK5_9LAMI|nr:hypothetical protein Salat_1177700 [Sesamum alatum]